MLKIRDRHDNDFCFGPTHEEVITDIAAPRDPQLSPVAGQFLPDPDQVRDEVASRFGVMRAREFRDEGCLFVSMPTTRA